MQLDVLSDIKTAVEKAIENGTTFEQFKKEIKPTLMKKRDDRPAHREDC